MRSATLFVCFAVLLVLQTAPWANAVSREDVIDQLRANVDSTAAYEMGNETELVISSNKTTCLQCSDNDCGVKEVLVGRLSMPGDILFVFGILQDGESGGGGTEVTRCRGAIRQVCRTHCLYVAKWQADGDKVTVKLRLETDVATNRSLVEQYASASGFAVYIPFREILVGDTEVPVAEARLAGFIRLWSEVKYNFAYFDKIPDPDWDKALIEYLPQVQNAQSTLEYFRVLQKCLASLHDGHTGMQVDLAGDAEGPPILVLPIEGKAVVVKMTETPEITAAGVKVGDEVVSVDGRAVSEILAKDIYPYISASTSQARDLDSYPQILFGPKGSVATLVLRDGDGTERTVKVVRDSHGAGVPPLYSPSRFEERDLADEITYVALRSFGSNEIIGEFDRVFGKISKSKGLIIDVRGNGGGSSGIGSSISGYLTDKELRGDHISTRQYRPAFRAWGRIETWYSSEIDPVEPVKGRRPFLGPVVVLTDAATGSAAEDFLVALHFAKRVTLVGEKTAGSTGQPLMVDLPEGGRARICTLRCTYPDGKEFVGVGVIPDIEVHPTIKDLVSGRDAVLEKSIEVIRGMTVDSTGTKQR